MEHSGKGVVHEAGGDSMHPPALTGREAAGVRPPLCTEVDENAVKNMEFFNTLDPEEAKKYMGEWLAVAGGRIVAHGKDPELVSKNAHEAGMGEPHMRYMFASPEEVPWLYVPE